MTRLIVSGLHKTFGTHPVLTGLDLEVPEGSLTAVLGPSGSGKTTLLRIVAGFERADAGRVTLGPTVVEDAGTRLAPERRGIGYVPQDGALFPHLSAAGNVGFGLSRRQRRQGRVEEMLALVGLAGEGRLFPHQLSGGQQQRVALARALARSPGLVLLDEPFASLDAALRAGVRADVRRVLHEAGATAVLVTHDQDEALSLADQVAVMRDGRVAQLGSPDDLYLRPLDAAMAGFVGDANLLPGVARAGRAITWLGSLELDREGGSLADGTRLVVLIRPERIRLDAGGEDAFAAGTVVDCDYYGHDMMVSVDTDPDRGGGRLRARLSGRPAIPAGTRVTLSATGSVRAWPAAD